MAITKIDITTYLENYLDLSVIDVRSPGEYTHARIPGSISLPLFDDEERKIVGTVYKQQSREDAIKIGLDFFGKKMRQMVEEIEKKTTSTRSREIIVHCWRGGMRSAGVAWLLDLYGFKVYSIIGGYKSFRNWVIKEFDKEHKIKILGGYTGSGKTEILSYLQEFNKKIIDLEAIAKHKGSAFGALGMGIQPSQEMFENLLAVELFKSKSIHNEVWLEDESQRIGLVNIPTIFWNKMRSSSVHFLEISFEKRLEYITEWYGTHSKSDLSAAIIRIQKRLGGLESKTALNYLTENNIKECFSILLKYYDKLYSKSLQNRPDQNPNIKKIKIDLPGSREAALKILEAL